MNTEFENIILKKLIHNGEFFSKIMPILKSKYFSEIGSQELFKLIKEYYSQYKNIPSLTELIVKVKNVSNVEIRSEIIKLLKCVSEIEEIKNIDFMLNETISWIKDALYLEALQIGSDGLMKKDDSLKLKAQKLMDERAKITIDSDLGIEFDNIQDMIDYYSKRDIGILTQHKSLNKRLGPGFLPGTLSVILAASGIGKSLSMSDLISGMIQNNKNILMVSLEMSKEENMKRVHSNVFDLPINNLRDLSLTEGEIKKILSQEPTREFVSKDAIISAYNKIKLSGKCGKLFIKDYPPGSFSPLMLEQLVESYKIEKNIKFDLIFIDYLGIMKSDLVTPSVGLYSYVKSIAEELRASLKKMCVPGISASQLNRGATNAIDGVDNSNTSDSMGTVMTADFMMFLLQNENMKKEGMIICKITKNRFNGMTDDWLMNIDYTKMRFSDAIVQKETTLDNITNSQKNTEILKDDFGLITAQKAKDASEYAKQEIKEIVKEDLQKIKEHNKKLKDPFDGDDLESLYKELGI
jgi:replicative DNA helicase